MAQGENRTYIAIDLKSFYASVECVERGLDPLTTNLVVASDADVDRVLDAAIAAGATVARPPSNEEYGGRNAIVRDSEGNLWSIDSYPGE